MDNLCKKTPAIIDFSFSLPASFSTIEAKIKASDKVANGNLGSFFFHKLSENLKNSGSANTAEECFEGFSRAMFKLNHGLDKAIFEPVAKGYRALPVPIRQGSSNFVENLRIKRRLL